MFDVDNKDLGDSWKLMSIVGLVSVLFALVVILLLVLYLFQCREL